MFWTVVWAVRLGCTPDTAWALVLIVPLRQSSLVSSPPFLQSRAVLKQYVHVTSIKVLQIAVACLCSFWQYICRIYKKQATPLYYTTLSKCFIPLSYPHVWNDTIIVPIYKSGNRKDPHNCSVMHSKHVGKIKKLMKRCFDKGIWGGYLYSIVKCIQY